MRNPWVMTRSGRAIDLVHPDPREITLADVANALARIPRFNGHGAFVWSVAAHSLAIARHLAEAGEAPEVVVGGLLHDAAEYVLGDTPAPVKWALGRYAYAPQITAALRHLDDTITAAIFAAVAPHVSATHARGPSVKSRDRRILLDERAALFPGVTLPPHPWVCDGDEPLGVVVAPQPIGVVVRDFVDLAVALGCRPRFEP